MLPNLLLLLAIAGVLFFVVRAFQINRDRRALSTLELKRLEIEEARELAKKRSLSQRLADFFDQLGWDGNELTIVLGMVVVYVVLSAALKVAGLPLGLCAVIALPASGLALWTAAKWVANNRKKRFNRQLVEFLDSVARQIAAGGGVQTALNAVVPTMPDPLRSEFLAILDSPGANKDLPKAFDPLRLKYPSRAIRMFISALEFERDEGLGIADSLGKAAESLKAEFQLKAEATAEISQQRGEFFMILGILGGLAVWQILGADPETRSAYFSPMGITALVVAFANVLLGVWRLLNTLSNLEGGTE